MHVQVKTQGNDSLVIFPREFFTSAGLELNDVLTATIENGSIVLRKSIQHRTLRQRAAAFEGKLNLSEEADFGESHGDEVWLN